MIDLKIERGKRGMAGTMRIQPLFKRSKSPFHEFCLHNYYIISFSVRGDTRALL